MLPEREGSGSRQPGNQQFSFVTYQHPSGAKSDDARREVRSHVTSLQHRLSRQKRHEANEKALLELQKHNQREAVGPPLLPGPLSRPSGATNSAAAVTADGTSNDESTMIRHRSSRAPSKTFEAGSPFTQQHSPSSYLFLEFSAHSKAGNRPTESGSRNVSRLTPKSKALRQKSRSRPPPQTQHSRAKPDPQEPAERAEPSDLSDAELALSEVLDSTVTRERLLQRDGDGPYGAGISRQFDVSTKYARRALLNDPADSVAQILRRLHLDFSSVMEHYQWIAAAQAPDFERQFMADRPPRYGYRTLITTIPQDPALVAVSSLNSASHILAVRSAPISQYLYNRSDSVSQLVTHCIGRLRGLALDRINAALGDPKRACSDPLICAVLLMAAHEGLQGSRQNYDIHMKGLIQMINLRGGLSAINDSKPFLGPFIAWQDTNIATILRTPLYHKMALGAELAPVVTPNPMAFLLRGV